MTKSHFIRKPRLVQLPLPSEDVVIPLTRGFTTVVDWQDRDLSQLKWRTEDKSGYYAVRSKFSHGVNHTIKMHRLIVERILQRSLLSNERVDHINGNGLDNRRSNLRLATPYQNMQNAKRHSDNSSGYKGVAYDKRRAYWYARIQVNGKAIYLGSFDTAEQAYEAYCEAAKKYFGEFARTE